MLTLQSNTIAGKIKDMVKKFSNRSMETNNELLGLLSYTKFDPLKGNKEEFKKYFDKIARILMSNYVIKKGEDKYQIIETIEYEI